MALQPGDVPGMQRCAMSGSVNNVLAQEELDGSLAHDLHATEWEQWKQQGATDAYFAVFGASQADCAAASATGTGAPLGGLMVFLGTETHQRRVAAEVHGGIVAMWPNKRFESDFIGYAVADSNADQAVLDMNRRIL